MIDDLIHSISMDHNSPEGIAILDNLEGLLSDALGQGWSLDALSTHIFEDNDVLSQHTEDVSCDAYEEIRTIQHLIVNTYGE